MKKMFQNALSFNQYIGDWTTTNVLNMGSMFVFASSFNNGQVSGLSNASLNSWNTGNVTLMNNMFQNASAFNQLIGDWDTHSATNMEFMFSVTQFNQPLTTNGNKWNTGNVTSMRYMFNETSAFNQDVSSWDTSSVENFSYMFYKSLAFNNGDSGNNGLKPLTWNTTSATTLRTMFYASPFNQNVNSWNTSLVTDMTNTFALATKFNNGQAAGLSDASLNWNAPLCTSFVSMFNTCVAFNQNVSNLVDTSGLISSSGCNLSSMFQSAILFNNGDLSNNYSKPLTWDTKNVTIMTSTFKSASSFNQYIGNWDTSRVTDMTFMFQTARLFNNGETGTADISGNVATAYYTTSGSVLTCPDSAIISGLAVNNVIIITTGPITSPTIVYTSKIATIPTSTTLTLSTNYGSNIGTVGAPIITSIKKQVVGTRDMSWNTTSLPDMQYMFSDATYFNQRVDKFTVGNATQMFSSTSSATPNPLRGIFNNGQLAGSNDNSLRYWNTVASGSTGAMFLNSSGFNQNVSNWNVSNVGYMGQMFQGTRVYNNGLAPGFFNNDSSLNSWVTTSLTDFQVMFNGAISFNQNISNWDVSKVTTMNGTFSGATLFNNGDTSGNFNQPLTSWYAPKCVDFTRMFSSAPAFNQNISNLVNTSDVSACDLTQMFSSASTFNNGDISGSSTKPLTWITDNVNTMSNTFADAIAFNQRIDTSGNYWNTGNVTTMSLMFGGATIFNQAIGNWNVFKVTTMFQMFYKANAFNQPIGAWNTGSVTTMGDMFRTTGVNAFNKNISNWNVSNVTSMSQMFLSASVFNNGSAPGLSDASLNSWDTSKVTTMQSMFQNSFSFNQPIGNWNTSLVTTMQGMFQSCGSFNQPLITNGNKWNVSNVTTFTNMFTSAVIFNQYIGNWNTSSATTMVSMFFNAQVFNNGQTGTMDISGNLNTSSAFYTNSSRLLTCTGGNFTKLTSADVLIITTGSIASPTILYTSQIQTTPISDVSLVLLTAYGADILSGITSIKKQVAGTADLSWNTANVTTINGIFSRAPYFNQRLPWDVSNVTDMTLAFNGVTPALKSTFNNGQLAGSSTQPLTNASLVPWSPTKCRSFNFMFISTLGFNQPMLNFVDTSGITLDAFGNGVNLTSMFSSATVFNQNLNTWNVDNVTNMNNMFQTAVAYNNGSLTNDGANELLWSAPNCPNFTSMFQSATAFNQKVNNLVNTTNVIDCSLNSMFQAATLFNNGQTGTMDISGNPFIGASYTDATRLLTSLNSKFLTDLSSNDVLIITGTGFIYTSQIQPPIVSDVSLVLLTAYGANIGTGTITSVKKQVAGSAVLSWNTINVKNMSALFSGAYYFNQQLPWNVSNVTNMSSMFAVGTTALRDLFNNGQLAGSSSQPLNWTATKCTNFNSMFAYTSGFNQPITTLVDTSGVAGCSLTSMFQNTTVFNQNVGAWNVSRVTAMNIMFANTTVFNNGGPLNDTSNNLTWYAPNCINFTSMFQSAPAFNQSMPTLVDTSGITVGTAVVLTSMLLSATTFNQNISTWNTNNVTLMDNMFSGALAFNNGQLKPSDISGTITSGSYTNSTATLNVPLATFTTDLSVNNVLTIATGTITTPIIIYTSQIQRIISNTSLVLVTPYGSNILTGITSIKKQVIGDTSLNNWNTSNVTTMVNMFQNAYYFNQNISNWSTSKVTTMSSMFAGPSTLLKTTFNNGQLVGSSDASLNWTAPRCTTFASMFLNTSGFNQAMPYLVDVSCTTFINMFQNASVFNQNVSSWNTSSVTTMASVFQSARVFNNGQSVTQTVRGTPSLASYVNTTPFILTCPDASFNLDFSLNDGIIITMGGSAIYSSIVATIPTNATLTLSDTYPLGLNLAAGAITSIKKQVVGSAALLWNTQSVTNITSIFNGATYFNQQLPWNTRKVTNVTTVFIGSAAFINLFNNGQITGGASQRLYPGSGNTWDFSNNTITGGTSGAWCANSRLVVGVTGNGVTINPALT
jgi:surface protein